MCLDNLYFYLEMSDENVDHCSFVSIHYIICECGETFPSEDALKDHLEKEHPHKRERKEYKCGIVSECTLLLAVALQLLYEPLFC